MLYTQPCVIKYEMQPPMVPLLAHSLGSKTKCLEWLHGSEADEGLLDVDFLLSFLLGRLFWNADMEYSLITICLDVIFVSVLGKLHRSLHRAGAPFLQDKIK